MPIRIHTVHDPLLTTSAWRAGGGSRSSRRVVGDELRALLRSALVVLGPSPPRSMAESGDTVVLASAPPGGTASARLTVRNLQPSAIVVSPALGVLRLADGTTWTPEHALTAVPRVVSPGSTAAIGLVIVVAPDVPPGTYHGSVRFGGARGVLPVRITVRDGVGP